jgi:iron complex outermembrane receptor protein
MKQRALWLSASVLMLAWSSSASAQSVTATTPATGASTTVQEVVVTAERRTTNLQKTPIAATVLSATELQTKGVLTEDELQFVVPSLTVNNFGQGNDFDIRGIGKGEHNSQTTTGVVTYRDGVATFPGYFQEEPYYDIASVEVLRGPQGTFSGQNATGGAVIVNTQNPVIGGGYTGYVMAHYGNYNDTGLQGAVNLPINDTLAARFAVNLDHRDTFYDIGGPLTGDPNLNWGSLRGSVLWAPNTHWKILLKTDYDYLANGGYLGPSIYDQNPSDLFHFNNNARTFATDQFVRSTLKIDYVTDGGLTFQSVSGFQRGRTAWKADIDGTDLPAPNYVIAEAVDERIFSEEFNIISPADKPVTWILGSYFQSNKYIFPPGEFEIGVPPGIVDEDLYGENPTWNAAAFGQVSFNLPKGFQIQAGVRYSYWSTTNNAVFDVPEFGLYYPQNQTETGDNVTGKITLNWAVNDDNFLYAFVATGAKPGGLNDAVYFVGNIPPPFRQEYVVDYEGGWKARLFDGHLHTQLGFYYNSFKNFQVIIPIPDNPLESTELNNPSATKLYGFEASGQAVFGAFSATMGLGIEHSALGTVYAEDPRLATGGTCSLTTGPATSTCIDLAGHPQTYAPDFTFNTSAQYDFKLGNGDLITPSANFAHISGQWGTLFDNVSQGDHLTPRNILGAALAWTHGTFVTKLYGYNLTNDQYTSALLSPLRIAGAPRQFGVSIMKTF